MRRIKQACKWASFFLLFTLAAATSRAEVLIQYFETDWDEIYRRLPEIAEKGYEGMWIPPPCKSPNAGGPYAGGGNVGYSLYDRFDLGDVPQRGSLATRYGTRASLRDMVDNAHGCDIRVYPDVIFNHSGNGPDFRTYPGTKPNDYHGWFDGAQPGGFRRAPRMSAYDDINNGNGYTFQQELAGLFDLQTELDQRFITGFSQFSAPPAAYVRQPGWDERYPFNNHTNVAETTIQFMSRWINWLGYAMDFDGARMDAAKHVVAEFYGAAGSGFNHEIQWNFQNRHGYTTPDEFSDLFKNDIHRKNALIFAENFTGASGNLDYWRNNGVKMRYLDFPRKLGIIDPAFQNGNLAALSGSGLSDAEGVDFCQSHDQSAPNKLELAYAYVLTHVGLPVVYFTGNNLNGNDVNVKTWLKIGHGGALGDYNNGAIPNLLYINNNFARGREWERWSAGDLYAYERYDDIINVNQTPDTGEGLLLVALNDSGGNITQLLQTSFDSGTVLHDYTGNQAADVTVNGSGQVTITVPGNSVYPVSSGQGWVCYAPINASANGDPLRFSNSTSMNWVVPGGALATNKPRVVTRLTNDIADVDVYFNQPAGGGVDSVIVKWGEGDRVNDAQAWLTNSQSLVSYGYQTAVSNVGFWRLTSSLTNLPEGLHVVKGRCFNHRTGGRPALFQTFTEAVYVDRHGPDMIVSPAESSIVFGDAIIVISNNDRTAAQVDVAVDGGSFNGASMIVKGTFKYALTAISSGTHTATVRAIEQDWGSPRANINTSIVTRTFTVNAGGPSVALSFQNINRGVGSNIELPFFKSLVSAPGSSAKLYWDNYEIPLSGSGTFTNVFDGRYMLGGITDRLWGAFVNGTHFFDAVAINAGVTNHAVAKVTFNLYGSNQIDSDGDGLPDDVEMPNFSSGTAPGPNVPWPGDTSGSGVQDMIPNYGENWTRLNPMNADSDYDGLWDGDEDSDNNINSGDGVPNLCEVRQGYLQSNSINAFNIYNSGSKPASCVETNGGGQNIPAQITTSPVNPTRCPGNTLTVTYQPNQGGLSNSSPIMIAIGTNSLSIYDTNMVNISTGQWQHIFSIPSGATNITFWFHNVSETFFDNNGGANYSVPVGNCVVVTNFFNMEGQPDNNNYELLVTGMKILAAVKSNNLYVATWSANSATPNTDDHFVYVTDKFGAPTATPWAKAGNVYFDKSTKPYLSGESQTNNNGYKNFNNAGSGGRSAMGPSGAVMEGELNLQEVFGYVPDVVYIAAVAYGDADAGTLDSQCPPTWDGGNDLEITEFLPVPIKSIRDENLDGVFDCGKPAMETVVNGNTNDANYNLRRIYVDETKGDSQDITVNLTINGPGGTNVISDVELFSNLNRRDFASLPGDEDPETVTPASQTTYYRAYTMSGSGQGPYTATIKANKCGVYRINARYKINGHRYYYEDNGLRRVCAVVVSPKKALDVRLYEVQPMIAEAVDSTFFGRSTFKDLYLANTNKPDVLNTGHYPAIGVNMLWLQPIHPIGFDNRQVDPETGQPFDPGSPYAVRNYWKVNSVLGDPSTEDQAMTEFTNFVQQMDSINVGVMLDGTFNHSAWDCEVGDVAQQLFPGAPWAADPSALIRDVRPQWYSKKGNYGTFASFFNNANDTDIAGGPDRFDFGKWSDVLDFYFGNYDCLVAGQTDEWKDQYQSERDYFAGFETNATRELWQYFSYYPIYWLEKTGHPVGTPKAQSYKGIDGLRCDFAQGLPNQFWEYCINKTRSVKWDFLFMAESLDGFRTVNGNSRHGIGFRSSRQFDILNENMIFYWRDTFFNYNPSTNVCSVPVGNASTPGTFNAFDARRNAFDNSALLLNLVGHDELFPSDNPYRIAYAYAEEAAMDGAPMLLYGQEAGAQNSKDFYGCRGGVANNQHNWSKYEVNFGKGIPNFKRYNNMQNVWSNRDFNLQNLYGRINTARKNSTALRSQQNYFLSKFSGGGYDTQIFAVAKFTTPGVSAASQDVVFAFVNNNFAGVTNPSQVFSLNAAINGKNWFGIESNHVYNIVDLISTNPTHPIWSTNFTATQLISSGIFVGLPYQGQQAHYLRLIDRTVNTNALTAPDADGDGDPDYSDPDDDNDGLPDWWEIQYGLNPNDATGDNGAGGDPDGDGVSNYDEYIAGTSPINPDSNLMVSLNVTGDQVRVGWDSVPERNYRVQCSTGVQASAWQDVYFGTAFTTNESLLQNVGTDTGRFYRIKFQP